MAALEAKKKSPAAAKKASPAPKGKSPAAAKKGTAGTRFMNSKPKRSGAATKRDAYAPPDAPPAKKQKKEAAPKEADELDVKALSIQLMESITGKKTPKPAKAAKAEKPGKRKRETSVVEVDKIVGMRSKKSGVQYHIEWKDGTKTWEPEDNVMDDDLVDEFEEAEQVKVYGGATLSPGSEVEVKNVDEGFANSWSSAVVKKKEKGGKFTVEYSGFVDDDGEPMAEAGLERKRLRLAPDAAPKGWVPVVGEIVEVNEDDCWWEARVEKEPEKNKAVLKFRVSDEVKPIALGKKVRPCSWLKMS